MKKITVLFTAAGLILFNQIDRLKAIWIFRLQRSYDNCHDNVSGKLVERYDAKSKNGIRDAQQCRMAGRNYRVY